MRTYSVSHRRAFSLVELSIVLVILGLLTGGILAGQSLIRAAELRSVTTEQQRISTAMRTFRDKYMAYPGDMASALKFWPTCAAITTNLCYGDGDGLIENTGGNGAREKARAIQHLAFAGLIEGSYTGDVTTPARLGENTLASRLSNAGWLIGQLVSSGSDNPLVFEFGRVSLDTFPSMGVIMVEEAWNIDMKMDDGLAQSGHTRGWNDYSLASPRTDECADTTTGAFKMGSTVKNACRVAFYNQQ